MLAELRFGVDGIVAFKPRSAVAQWRGPRGEVIGDVRAATAKALASPHDFPPVRRAVVPGDRVVLAVEAHVPQTAAIVAAVVEAVLEGGVSPEDITVLMADDGGSVDDPRAEISTNYRASVQLATHHADARGEMSYLGADEQGRPIYMSRHILDADVVIPIECVRLDDSLGYGGARSTLYPAFADHDARQRCHAAANGRANVPASRRPAKQTHTRSSTAARGNGAVSQHEAEQIAWLMGVMFAVQVVPASADRVLYVLAGRTETVRRQGRELARQAWRFDVPQRTDLVVAGIGGDIAQQNWDNVGRAVAAARRVLNENGVIALCTQIVAPPTAGLRAVGGAENLEQAQRRLHKQKSADMPVALEWAQALDSGRVYLLSRLAPEEVELLGAGYVASGDEVGRLIDRSGSCLVLSNAQYVLPEGPHD